MRWAENLWDAAAHLLWNVGDAKLTTPHHSIRGSVWYAFGLLRNAAGDVARAIRIIETVLQYQFDAPTRVFHGTFFRAPEEPSPPDDAVIWRDYDPNWREFIVTVFALILLEYAERLPNALIEKIDGAIRRAVIGALARGLSAAYTNIALMHAFMLCFAGKQFNEPTWFAAGERMARAVHRLFKQHDAFAEYNSFRGERQIERVISDSPRRVATAWLGKDKMIGGEFTSRTPPQSNQLHPATIHWRIDAEHIGWVRAFYLEPIDARASKNRLEIETTSEIAFLVHAHGARIEQFARALWRLPNLSVRVETDAREFHIQPRDDCFEVRYIVAEKQLIGCALSISD